MIWTRQRQINQLRSMLRVLPRALVAFGDDLAGRDAFAGWRSARPGRRSGAVAVEDRCDAAPGRQRNVDDRVVQIVEALRSEQLGLSQGMVGRCGARPALAGRGDHRGGHAGKQCSELRSTLRFGQHPDAEIIASQPGVGVVLGAWALGEFGDASDCVGDANARHNYAGTTPVTQSLRHSLSRARSQQAPRRRPQPASLRRPRRLTRRPRPSSTALAR